MRSLLVTRRAVLDASPWAVWTLLFTVQQYVDFTLPGIALLLIFLAMAADALGRALNPGSRRSLVQFSLHLCTVIAGLVIVGVGLAASPVGITRLSSMVTFYATATIFAALSVVRRATGPSHEQQAQMPRPRILLRQPILLIGMLLSMALVAAILITLTLPYSTDSRSASLFIVDVNGSPATSRIEDVAPGKSVALRVGVRDTRPHRESFWARLTIDGNAADDQLTPIPAPAPGQATLVTLSTSPLIQPGRHRLDVELLDANREPLGPASSYRVWVYVIVASH